MNTEFGLKELYEVAIRATYPIEVGNRTIEAGEVVAAFDKVQLANFTEIKTTARASGGFDNRGLVFWESTKEVQLNFVQGIFSKTQLALLTNAELIAVTDNTLQLSCRELLESNEDGIITLSHDYVVDEPIFLYNADTSEKLTYTKELPNQLIIEQAFQNVLADYSYIYTNNSQILTVGRPLTQGFLTLEGKTRVKDDVTGQTHTGIIYIPKLKLMSDLSMRLGRDAMPIVGRLNAIALPIGDRSNKEVMSLLFLDDDIDSDL